MNAPEIVNPNATLSVSILSGKGGVGKTNLALNLGFALHRSGRKVLVMDFDVGLAHVDVLLGLSPEKTLQDLFMPETTAEDAYDYRESVMSALGGHIVAGEPADLIVVSENPLAAPDDEILDIRVHTTVNRGRIVYGDEAVAAN